VSSQLRNEMYFYNFENHLDFSKWGPQRKKILFSSGYKYYILKIFNIEIHRMYRASLLEMNY
jgi:hypothetical protein